MKNPPIPDPSLIKTEDDALDQSIALNRIVMAILQNQKEQIRLLIAVLIISILVNLCSIGAFLWYESQFVYTTKEVTTTVTQEVSGENSNINNVEGNQYNDNAIHNDDRGGVE